MAIGARQDDESGATFIRTPSSEREAPIARTTSVDPLVETMLGEYRVLSRLGAGGMGVVYRGEQPLLSKPVAIKVLQDDLAQDPQQVQRLLEEARAVCAAHHPNIVDIFSFGQTPAGRQYFVMELLDGAPLDEWVREQGQVSPPDAIELLKQVLAALTAAHAAGVVHRDLKPSNIFLARLSDGSRFVKLLDFGLAKRTAPNSGTSSSSNIPVGTPLYMAPEQAVGEELGPWTDLYAVGVLAYELLTGTVPFNAPTIPALLAQHATAAPVPLLEHAPAIPNALNTLVLELLEKTPARRPRSASVVKRELERIERQMSVEPTRLTGLRPPPSPAPNADPATMMTTFRPAQTPWGWISAGVVAAIAVGVGTAAFLAQRSQPSPVQVIEVAPTPVAVAVPEPAPPAAVEPVAVPVAAPAPVVAERPKSVPHAPHTLQELQRRIARVKLRAKDELTGGAQRAVLNQLEEYAKDPACVSAPEPCWKELTAVERDNFQ